MRNIYPQNNSTEIMKNEQERVTQQDINAIVERLNDLQSLITQTQHNLYQYEEDINTQVITEALKATNATITSLSAQTANFENVTSESLNSMSALVQSLTSTIATLQSLTATSLNVATVQGSNAQFGSVNVLGTIKAQTADIENWAFENLNIEDLTVTGDFTADSVETNSLNVNGNIEAEDVAAEDVTADSITTPEANIQGAAIDTIDTSRIVWKDYQTLVDPDIFYLEVPHFENGHYFIAAENNGETLFTIEIANSIDNYFIRWSQKLFNYIQEVYPSGTGPSACLYFRCQNLDGGSINLKYACLSKSNVGAPSTYETLPVSPENTYEVTYLNGNKFFKPIDLHNEGSAVGSLTMTQTEIYAASDNETKTYDTTENVVRNTYKPNQSLNKADDVEFNSVTSPFLGVADLTVEAKFRAPNIYNGPSKDLTEFEDGTLYMPFGSTTGVTVPGVAIMQDIGAMVPAMLHRWASTPKKSFFDEDFVHDEYKPTDGYDVDYDSAPVNPHESVYNVARNIRQEGGSEWYKLRIQHIIRNESTNKYYVLAPSCLLRDGGDSSYIAHWCMYDLDLFTTGTYTSISYPNPIATVLCNDARTGTVSQNAWDDTQMAGYFVKGMGTPYYYIDQGDNCFWKNNNNFHDTDTFFISPNQVSKVHTGDRFYYSKRDDSTGRGWYTVVAANVMFEVTNGIPYQKASSTGGSATLNRIKTINNVKEAQSIIPYTEVSTELEPVDNTHPLVYDTDTDSIKKSTSDITIEGDLDVKTDLEVTGESTFTGDASFAGDAEITGDLEVNGKTTLADLAMTGDVEINGTTTIDGDLYVNGKTHTIESEDISATGDVITLRSNNPAGLAAGQISGILVNNYDGQGNGLGLVTDEDGTLRVGTGTGTSTVYNKVALKSSDGKYYTYDDTVEPYTYTIMNPQPAGTLVAWTNKQEVTGYTLYATATFLQVSKTSLEALATRDEEANLVDKGIAYWDVTAKEFKTYTKPTENQIAVVDSTGLHYIDITNADDKVLKAHVNSGAEYHWSAITFDATGYAQMLYTFPENNDTPFMDLELKQGTKPTPVPAQATTVTHSYNDFKYYTETDKIVSYDSVADKYYEVFFNNDGTCWVDDSTPTVVDPQYLVDCTITSEKIDNVHGVTYTWEAMLGNYVFNTMADYTAVASTIPDGASIIILNENTYVKAE